MKRLFLFSLMGIASFSAFAATNAEKIKFVNSYFVKDSGYIPRGDPKFLFIGLKDSRNFEVAVWTQVTENSNCVDGYFTSYIRELPKGRVECLTGDKAKISFYNYLSNKHLQNPKTANFNVYFLVPHALGGFSLNPLRIGDTRCINDATYSKEKYVCRWFNELHNNTY